MKKSKILLLVVALVLVFALGLTACGEEHTHTFEETWTTNATHHWHKATCEHTAETEGREAHIWDDGVVTTAATETADGVMTYTCGVCGATKTAAIPKVTHVHAYATAWSTDANFHWHAATCDTTHAPSEKGIHTFGEAYDVVPATEAVEGSSKQKCLVCEYVKTNVIPKADHVHDYGAPEVLVAATCKAEGTSVVTCSGCGDKITSSIPKLTHTSSEYVEMITKAPTCTAVGRKTLTCPCGADVITEIVAKLPHSPSPDGRCQICNILVGNAGDTFTYNIYTTASPSNWNELSYQDNNDTQIMNYLGISFFSFDYKFDDEGEILPGQFEMMYMGADALEDVSVYYAKLKNANDEYVYPWLQAKLAAVIEAGGTEADFRNYAFKVTLRNDLCWENGVAIDANTYVYSMQQQLDPLFLHRRIDSFYALETVIHGAQNYAYQGHEVWMAADSPYTVYPLDGSLDAKLVFDLDPVSVNNKAAASFRGSFGFPDSYTHARVISYLKANYITSLDDTVAIAMQGKTLAEIKADATMKAEWEKIIGWWQTDPNEELDFFITYYEWPEYSWDDVGFIKGDTDLELVFLLDNALNLMDEEGELTYQCAYNLSGFPLVYEPLYEPSKIAPTTEGGLWTSNYHTKVENTISCGPYKLTVFQQDKLYILEKNDRWFGYNMPENDGMYQTDRIVCETIANYDTALLKFWAGELDGIGIQVTIADNYKGSARAYYTPGDYVDSMQLQSKADQLAARETEGVNKTILSIPEFRQAMALSIDRADYTRTCTTAYRAGYGLFTTIHYYDVANGGAYRFTDAARQALCDAYGIDVEDYASLEAAERAVTGYDEALAIELFAEAYRIATTPDAEGNTLFNPGDRIEFEFGTQTITAIFQIRVSYLEAAWKKVLDKVEVDGAYPFKDKFSVIASDQYGSQWANEFRAGKYDICLGGWTGATWNPAALIGAYLDPSNMYSAGWNTDSQMLTLEFDGEEYTLSLLAWQKAITGQDAEHRWGAGQAPMEERLKVVAALEREVLMMYYTVPMAYEFGASLLGFQIEHFSWDYHTFMSYGGIRRLTYNYTDASWNEYVQSQGGDLSELYKA